MEPVPDLFASDDYHAWIREAIALRGDPDCLPLFDSTIDEPVAELTETIRAAFWPSVSSRYLGVFGSGNPFMLNALADRYNRPCDSFIATSGATAAMGMALKSLVGPGDHVLVETPGFYLLESLAADTGADVEFISRRAPDFLIDHAELQAKLRPQTKALLITNLHNPSGALMPASTIQGLAGALAEVGAVLIVDEVYRDFALDAGAAPGAALADNILTVSSLTKVFGLFSLKAGWMTAAPALLDQIRASQPEGDYNVGKLSHAIAALVLEQPEPYQAHWKRVLHANRPIVARHADQLLKAGLLEGEVPAHGCIYFPRVVGCADAKVLARRLWRECKVLAAPGEYFGAPGHLRISFGSADSTLIEQGFARLAKALPRLVDKAS